MLSYGLLIAWRIALQDTDQAVDAVLCTRLYKVDPVELELFQDLHPVLSIRNFQRKHHAAMINNIHLAKRQQS